MNFAELYRKEGAGAYDPSVQATNSRMYREAAGNLMALFEADCRTATDASLGITTTDLQWQRLYQEAWEDGHSDGLRSVVDALDSYVALIKLFVEAQA